MEWWQNITNINNNTDWLIDFNNLRIKIDPINNYKLIISWNNVNLSAQLDDGYNLYNIEKNTWTHVSIYYNKSRIYIYINGLLKNTTTYTYTPLGILSNLTIGKQITGYITNFRFTTSDVYGDTVYSQQNPLFDLQFPLNKIVNTTISVIPTVNDRLGQVNGNIITSTGTVNFSNNIPQPPPP